MKGSATKVIVGLSGGVDSAVAAHELIKAGYNVRAVFMKNFSERISKEHDCPWREDRLMAYRVAAHLDIPIETWDFEKEYKEKVVEYVYTEYQAGRTPNPDIMCNKEIKFKVFLIAAKKRGYSQIATGHYARIKRSGDGIYHLLKGKDPDKDQSYFLAALKQEQLRHVIFPLGGLTKPEVRKQARKLNLPNHDRPDSQGICFVGEVKIEDFLKRKIRPKKGLIKNTAGSILGEHNGIYFFTIGQRRGLKISSHEPLYVISKNVKKNELIVGTDSELDLYTKSVRIKKLHWLAGERKLPIKLNAKIRYRQHDQKATLTRRGSKLYVVFQTAQRAVASGQTIAFYKGAELVASAIID